MPYIKQNKRPKYDELIEKLNDVILEQNTHPTCGISTKDMAGDITYIIYSLLLTTIAPVKYWHYALMHGILDTCSRELYRQKTAKYEHIKMIENGDVV